MKKASSKDSGTDLLDPKNFENNEELIITREIEDTPFVVVGVQREEQEERTWFGALGNIKLTPDYKSDKEVIDHVTPVNWNNIINLVAGLQQLHSNQNKRWLEHLNEESKKSEKQ